MRASLLTLLTAFVVFATQAQAGSLTYALAAANGTAADINYAFAFSKPYAGGIGVVKQSIGMTGVDKTGNGYSLTNITLDTLIDNAVVHTANFGDCTLGAGGAGRTLGCAPGGDQWSTTSKVISESGTGPFGIGASGTLSAGDAMAFVLFGSLNGTVVGTGSPVTTFMAQAFTLSNSDQSPLQFSFDFADVVANARYTSVELNLAGALLDLNGGGASVDLDVQAKFNSNLLGLGIQDACSINNGVLSGTICRGGTNFGPSSFSVIGPNSGSFGQALKFTLSGDGDAVAVTGAAEWGPGSEVPEPGTWAMMLGGLAVMALRRRMR